MVTVIHVVDTLEPTQSLPPVAAIPRSACLSTASLRAWQGHGAVSYYKRRSPSLLQETQTHQSPVHPPHTHTPQYPSSSINYICWGGLGDNTEAQSGQGTLKLCLFFAISFWRCLCLYANDLVSRALQRCAFTTCSGQSRLLISEWGHGKSHRFPFKLKIK